MLVLVIINISYISYAYSRSFFTVYWPLYLLRYLTKFFVTILFFPILGNLFIHILTEFLMSIFSCEIVKNSKPTKYIHSYAKDLICFQEYYFLHGFFALVASAFFVFICIVIALIYFECNDSPEIKTAR